MEELRAIKLLRQVLLGEKPLELSTKPMPTQTQATKKRLVDGELIGSKRNNIQPASRKQVQQLIDAQLCKYAQSVIPEADKPSGPSPGLPYISDYDSDSDSDSDDESTDQFPYLPEDEDDIPPAPRYNLRSKSINATVLNAVATTIKQHQLEINPDIIPPLIVKLIARLTKGYSQANELLLLSQWAWSRLSETDSLYANAIIDEKTGK